MIYELSCDFPSPILQLQEPIPKCHVKLGTTRGTNALLERKGGKTVFITSEGFKDILKIGNQNRPKIFDLSIQMPEWLFQDAVEINERIAVDGTVIKALEEQEVRTKLQLINEKGFKSLAICLMNAYKYPKHEIQIAKIAQELGVFENISLSHVVSPLCKIVSRGDTTVLDAYLNPVLTDYIQKIKNQLSSSKLELMTSLGGLTSTLTGKDSILSGPAGGVVGFSKVAKNCGFSKSIGFDMGGTSTDVSRFDKSYEYQFESVKAGVRIQAPCINIETVAAGGGSICSFDGVKLTVGPESSGAFPGPACYGRDGPLSVTDINFYLGKVLAQHFPFQLHRQAVENRILELIAVIKEKSGVQYTPVQLCIGFLKVANANMVKAIRSISIAKGYDPREYILMGFGGAAGQHVCAIANELGMQQILIHPDSGLLSAYGIGNADVVKYQTQGIYQEYSESYASNELQNIFNQLEQQGMEQMQKEGIESAKIQRQIDLRYKGLDSSITITESQTSSYLKQYEQMHLQMYGYIHQNKKVEIVAARVQLTAQMGNESQSSRVEGNNLKQPEAFTNIYFEEKETQVGVFLDILPGDLIQGPALIQFKTSVTIVDPGWQAQVLTNKELLLSRFGQQQSEIKVDTTQCDPITLELFNNAFMEIAEQMGIVLRDTSTSVNVKERLDFSCAIFTKEGDLVVNAPHIPVHLGAMGETIK